MEQVSEKDLKFINGSRIYLDIFNELCPKDISATVGYLKKLNKVFTTFDNCNTDTKECDSPPAFNFSLSSNKECDNVGKELEFHMEQFEQRIIDGEVNNDRKILRMHLGKARNVVNSITLHLKLDVRKGIAETKKWVESLVNIAEEWLIDTPWAKNYNALEKIQKITGELRIYDDYETDLEEVVNFLTEAELSYSNCKRDFQDVTYGVLFCQIYTSVKSSREKKIPQHFFLPDNAFNLHPILLFGLPNYYHTQYGNEFASKVGYTGCAVGHEIGHTFIDNFEKLHLLNAFSKEAQSCILEQFKKTCNEFKEKSCDPGIWSLDDDGADIFGLQLAYEFLARHYGNKLQTKIEKLGITNDQLFFYSYAYSFCSGNLQEMNPDSKTHSVDNVRVNVAAQHPGFQKAFGCSDDSRMIKSATKQCIVYGKDAPQTRRKLIGSR